MQASKTERYLLLGVVPVLAAAVGAVATVILQKYLGGAPESDVTIAIIKMQGVSVEEKQKLLQLANSSTDRFYGFLNFALAALVAPLGALLVSIGRRISG